LLESAEEQADCYKAVDIARATVKMWPAGTRSKTTATEEALYALGFIAKSSFNLCLFDDALDDQKRTLELLRQVEPRAVAYEESFQEEISAAKHAQSTSADGGLVVGERVVVHGLLSARKQNGTSGILRSFDTATGGWQLGLLVPRFGGVLDEDNTLDVKSGNLRKVDACYGLPHMTAVQDDRKIVAARFVALPVSQRASANAPPAVLASSECGVLVMVLIRDIGTGEMCWERGFGTMPYFIESD